MHGNLAGPGRTLALLTLAGALAGCGGGIRNPFEPELPNARITILAGAGGQTVALGDSLVTPVTARLEIDGAPAGGRQLRFMVIADVSPGPNHTWMRTTDSNGTASGNGVIQNTGKGGARIVVVYDVCMDPLPIKECTKYQTAGSAETRITVN